MINQDITIKSLQTPYGVMRYSIHGQGPVLLVAHGSGGGDDQGRLIAERFFPDCCVIAVSRFGYLGSEMPNDPSNKIQAAVYKYILESENIQSTYITGLSAGGPSAIEFAIEYPEFCKGLILISALGVPTLNEGVKVRRIFSVIARSDFFYGLIALFVRNRKNVRLPITEKIALHLNQEDEHFVRFMFTTVGSLKSRLRGMWHDRSLNRLNADEMKQIKARTLIVHALDDGLVSPLNSHFAASVIPHAETLILPEGGHLLLTKHDKIKSIISTFLEA